MKTFKRDFALFLVLSAAFYVGFSIFNGSFNCIEWGDGSKFVYSAGLVLSALNIRN